MTRVPLEVGAKETFDGDPWNAIDESVCQTEINMSQQELFFAKDSAVGLICFSWFYSWSQQYCTPRFILVNPENAPHTCMQIMAQPLGHHWNIMKVCVSHPCAIAMKSEPTCSFMSTRCEPLFECAWVKVQGKPPSKLVGCGVPLGIAWLYIAILCFNISCHICQKSYVMYSDQSVTSI